MASIRRNLSPVPRPGISLSGEACSVASPLSRSSFAHNSTFSGGLISTLPSSVESQALVVGVLSPRPSRSLEKPKPRGQVLRRALFQFLVCFLVGFFIGLTPFNSLTLSSNFVAKHQAISFDMISALGNFQSYNSLPINAMPLNNEDIKNNATVESHLMALDPNDGISQEDKNNQSLIHELDLENRKLLIIVTPTYAGTFQVFYLNRLAYTLKLVSPPLLWIVVEMTSQYVETSDILRRSGVVYRHLICKSNLTDISDRRAHQRNVALNHIETHRLDGIVFSADEENIYSVYLFEQMRQIRRFGTWMVAKLAEENSKVILEGPICNGTQVIGWHINGVRKRLQRFHSDISGFAFNSTIVWDPKRWHRPTLEPIRHVDTVKDGLQVSTFIEQVVEDESQMEGLLQDCSKIMAWQVHPKSFNSLYPNKWFLNNNLDVFPSLK